ncbi:MAG: hypothetical protein ACPG5R_01875 [Cognaticolwellia aestuarii]
MNNAVFNFKGFVVLVMILLLTQQSFAAFMPMNCDDMKETTVVHQANTTHIPAQMHEHNSQSKDHMAFHEACDICDSIDCHCGEMGGCFGSYLSTTTQKSNNEHMLFVDHGKRFLSLDQYPDSGVYLHPFRPPINT